MAEFIFNYGVMNSSKSANLLMEVHNLETWGRRVLCLKSALDTRWADGETKKGKIESRAFSTGHECELVDPQENVFQLVKQYNSEIINKYSVGISAVFVDEAQFLKAEQVGQLADVVEKLNIDVYCYGLKNTYVKGELFEGSAALLYYATSLKEITTFCKYCQKKATMNMRVVNGKAVYEGNQIQVGDVEGETEVYAQVCYHHYLNPPAFVKGFYSKSAKKTGNDFKEIFNHILSHENEYGYYHKKSEVLKVSPNLKFDSVFIANKESYEKLRYIAFGPLLVDVKEFALKYNTEQKNGLGDNINNSKIITEIFIDFVYTLFENDKQKAYRIFKDSEVTGITFFDTEDDFLKAYIGKSLSTKKRFDVLPDGHHYYYDFKSRNGWPFWERVLSGISRYLGNEKIGFYIEE